MARLLEHRVAYPEERRYQTPLLLLHGAWHGAWCWERALDDFARRGFETHAISLRGHGESAMPPSINLCRVSDYVRDLGVAVAGISPRPVVVGHSLGGFVLQHYIRKHELPGAILLCSIPTSGALRFLSGWMLWHPLATLQMLLTLNTLHLVGTPDLTRAAFFRRDIAPDALERYTALLCPESLLMALQACLPITPAPAGQRPPVQVIAAERDRIFTVPEQRATAEAYGAELLVVPAAAHDLMLDPAWLTAADAIERAAAQWAG